MAPDHEAIVGLTYMTEPDTTQEVREFSSEEDVLNALKEGTISKNTPIRLKS